MTQSPYGGQPARTTTELDDELELDDPVGDEFASDDAPSPSSPTGSTPWGTTSTSSGSATHADGHSAANWAAQADAPTTAVPLVQGTRAPLAQGTPPPLSATVPPPVAEPVPPIAGEAPNRVSAARARGPRRARLQLRHINPWTVLKFSCVLSIALFFVWLIVIGVLFGVLDAAGVIGKINSAYTTIQGGNSQAPVTAGVVFGGAAIVGLVNIVLFIALTTVGSVVYNLCADLVGGIEITLSER